MFIAINNPPAAIVEVKEVEYEGFSNQETWFVCLQLQNNKDLYDAYRWRLRQHPTFTGKVEAIQKLVTARSYKFYTDDRTLVELNNVNWEELVEDLCHSME